MIKNEIIEIIRKNRISSTEVADCMDKTGALESLCPLNKLKFAVGPVRWIYGYNGSNWEVHKQLRDVQKGEIVLVELFNCDNKAVFGSLVSKYLFFYKEVEAIIVFGKVRDAHTLIKEQYPIWSYGVTPIGCTNKENDCSLDENIIYDRLEKYKDSIAVCDDSGVVIIPSYYLTKEFVKKLDFIEEQEDIWFDCVDRKKWDTFDTVCLKKYLD